MPQAIHAHTCVHKSTAINAPNVLQVGGVLAGSDKGLMEFQLRARSDATIDLRSALRLAGHTIPEGCTANQIQFNPIPSDPVQSNSTPTHSNLIQFNPI